jgi:hypothetical protein
VTDAGLHSAREAVEAERAEVCDHRDALESFADRLPAASAPSQSTGAPAVTAAVASTTAGCEPVRTAFAETVGGHAEGETVLAGIEAEFGPDVAVALAPAGERRFTAPVREQVLAAVRERRAELAVLDRALEREATSLSEAATTVERVSDWLGGVEDTPLIQAGFETLRARHDQLEEYRADCGALLEDRQELLVASTGTGGTIGLPHRRLVRELYEDLAVDYPVLSTAARLRRRCAEYQRQVRDHLARRV